ncbi:hypothetical protein ABE402_09205 [Bacillus smithii]|uniref:hypothetical protein n=1 Tax=Bacillus smithii TaxID=1479 RepID=UPI003D21A13A
MKMGIKGVLLKEAKFKWTAISAIEWGKYEEINKKQYKRSPQVNLRGLAFIFEASE